VDPDALQARRTFLVRQRLTLMVNRYEVRALDAAGTAGTAGTAGPVIAFAQQKRMAFREQVTLYTDESRREVLAGFKARSVIDIGATYDVTDGSGAPIGLFRKDFARSLLRSTWLVEQPGLATMSGQERDVVVAVLRRFADLDFLPYHFDFVREGAPAFSVTKKWGIRDTYVVAVDDDQVDRRLVIAMAVALDALQGR
jgi:uncharacterized protein YxjI